MDQRPTYRKKSSRRRRGHLSPAFFGLLCVCALLIVGGGGFLIWRLAGNELTLPANAQPSSLADSPVGEDPSADVDPSFWLTDQELATAEGETLTALVSGREELCLQWLSAEETQRLTAAQKLNVATQRKEQEERAAKAAETLDGDSRVAQLDSAAYDVLLAQLCSADEGDWEDLIAQASRGKEALAIDAEASLKASNSMAWLTGDARQTLIDAMVVAPKSEWANMIRAALADRTADQSKLKTDAETTVDAADTKWLTSADRTALINKLLAADRSTWNSLVSQQVAGKSAYLLSLAKSAVKGERKLSWLTGNALDSFLAELVAADRSKWDSMLAKKIASAPVSSSSSSSSEEEDDDDDDDDSKSNDDDDDDDDGGTGAWSGTLKITNISTGRVVSGSAYDIVAQVVQNEVGSSFHSEAIKAQAVAAYSFIKYENSRGRSPSHYLSTPSSTVKKAVSAVEGEAVYYNGKIAFTPFFSASNGSTTSSKDVWGGSYAYLVSVDSSVDEDSPHYGSVKTMSENSVQNKLENYFSSLDLDDYDPSDWFEVVSYTDGGYNGKMKVGNKSTTGRVLRESVLGLKSAAFEVDYDGSDFTFTTYGYGHGVGMSQYGAHYYAKDGWDYVEILEHYYDGCTVR